MAKKLTLLLLTLLPFIIVLPIHAQGNFMIESNVELGNSAIRESAQPLVDRGANVVVHIIQSGTGFTHDAYLREQGLMTQAGIPGNLITVFVSLDNRVYEIRSGEQWSASVLPRAHQIVSTNLTSNFREPDFTLAVIRTLEAIEAAIVLGPPVSALPVIVIPESEPAYDLVFSSVLCLFVISMLVAFMVAPNAFMQLMWYVGFSFLFDILFASFDFSDDRDRRKRRPLFKSDWTHYDS